MNKVSEPRSEARGRAGRCWAYCAEMFPPAVQVPVSAASFFSLYFLLQLAAPLRAPLESWLGAATVFFLLLFLRVSDELKDFDLDQRLFPQRPSARGVVGRGDLQILWSVILLVLCLLNLAMPPKVLLCFAGLIAYALAMARWFFLEARIRPSISLALLSHNPIVGLMAVYICGLAAELDDSAWTRLPWLLPALWAPSLAWEIGRKIRAPQQEDDYTTYSKVWGPRRSAALVALLCALSLGLLAFCGQGLLRGPLWLGLVSGLAAIGCFSSFALWPEPVKQARLNSSIEAFLATLHLGLVIGLVWSRGLAIR